MTNYLVRTYTTAVQLRRPVSARPAAMSRTLSPGSCSISRPMPRPWSASHRTGTWSIAVKEAASTSGTPRLAARFEEFRSGTPRALRRGPSHPRPTAADSFPWAARWTRKLPCRAWAADSGVRTWATANHPQPVVAVALAADPPRLLTVAEAVRVWDLATGRQVGQFANPRSEPPGALSPAEQKGPFRRCP